MQSLVNGVWQIECKQISPQEEGAIRVILEINYPVAKRTTYDYRDNSCAALMATTAETSNFTLNLEDRSSGIYNIDIVLIYLLLLFFLL